MLTDPEEIRIIANARQKNVADPNRSREHFVRIFEDFLCEVDFGDKVLLDLGPGQYDFAELSRKRGAITHGIDNDPWVVKLGEYKKFPARLGNLKDLKALDYDIQFDGVFCKYSINAFWFYPVEQELVDYIREIVRLIKPGGWAWIAPWNGVPTKANISQEGVDRVLSAQALAFKEAGFSAVDLTESLSRYYGVHGRTGNRALFFLNLPRPDRLKKCRDM